MSYSFKHIYICIYIYTTRLIVGHLTHLHYRALLIKVHGVQCICMSISNTYVEGKNTVELIYVACHANNESNSKIILLTIPLFQ